MALRTALFLAAALLCAAAVSAKYTDTDGCVRITTSPYVIDVANAAPCMFTNMTSVELHLYCAGSGNSRVYAYNSDTSVSWSAKLGGNTAGTSGRTHTVNCGNIQSVTVATSAGFTGIAVAAQPSIADISLSGSTTLTLPVWWSSVTVASPAIRVGERTGKAVFNVTGYPAASASNIKGYFRVTQNNVGGISTTETVNGNVLTTTLKELLPDGPTLKFSLDVPYNAAGYDAAYISENGPWRSLTYTVAVTPLALLTTSWMELDNSINYGYRFSNPLWQKIEFEFVGGSSLPTGDAAYPITDNSVELEYQGSSVSGTSVWNAASWMSVANNGENVGDYKALSGVKPVTDYVVVLTQGISYWGDKLYGRVKHVSTVEGECTMASDCSADKDDRRAILTTVSANGDDASLVTCRVLPSAADASLKTSRCMECSQDCDCRAGQYCHKDTGAVQYNSKLTMIDPSSQSMAGSCRWKDAAGSIFGEPCTDASVDVVLQPGSSRSLPDGKCGGFLFYNSSYVPDSASSTQKAYTVRATLWEGTCVGGRCQECSTGSGARLLSSACENQQCVNGRNVPRRDVDLTVRTFNANTVAGTVLAAVFGLILLNLLACCGLAEARSYHKKSAPKPGMMRTLADLDKLHQVDV